MATIAELAQMSADVYNGTQSSDQPNPPDLLTGLSSDWTVVTTSAAQSSDYWQDGYFAVVYRNTLTGEIVIANRGTSDVNGATLLQNLLSDRALAASTTPTVDLDALAFAKYVVTEVLPKDGISSIPDLIETGHSLGGSEAQAAVAALASLPQLLKGAAVSGVVFNSPGIGSNISLNLPATSYNVLNIVTQGDVVHLAGGTQLGDQITIAAGPDTSGLVMQAPDGMDASGIGEAALLGAALYDILGPAHSIDTILSYLSPGNPGSDIGSTDWTTTNASSVQGSVVNENLPQFSFNAQGALVITDPASNISVTMSLSTDGQHVLATFSNNGGSAVGQALASLGQVTVPIAELNQSLGSLNTASPIYETISRNAAGAFDVTFQPSSGAANPATGDQFAVTAAIANNAFDYAVPTTGQLLVETIDNGPGNGTGTITVLSGSNSTQLTGGRAVAGETDTWTDSNGDQYAFAPSTPGSSVGTLNITNGLLGSPGNAIVVDNFDVAVAQGASGYLGIYLDEALTLSAGAGGGSGPASFAAGSGQFYTLSLGAPAATAQTVTLSLSGASPSDFEVVAGSQVLSLSQNGSFTLTLAAGQTSLTFELTDITAQDGSSDIANGATLQLTASVADPQGGSLIQSAPLAISYIPGTSDTSELPQAFNPILGQYNSATGVTTYTSDGGNDLVSATGATNYIALSNSASDSITGGSGSNTIYGGSGNDVITLSGTQDLLTLGNGFDTVSGSATGKDTIYGHGGDAIISGNGGTDLIFGGNGDSAIYAGAQTSLAQAIAQAGSATATGKQGDLIAVGDGDNTIVGGDGNDLITAGSGSDVIVLGPGNDTFEGGWEVTDATANWAASVTGSQQAGYLMTATNVDGTYRGFTNPYPQPYNGGEEEGTQIPFGPANDTVYGGTGNDFISLGNGNNYVSTGSGNDTVYGGMGNDTIIAGAGNDFIRGGGGTTYIVGGVGADTLAGGDGNNTIIGGAGNATINSASGPNGSDSFAGASLEQNYVDGGSGNDVIYGSAGNDTLIAGSGNSTIYGQSGNESMTGGSGNDLLVAGSGNATISAGGDGKDTLQGGTGTSSTYILYGGDGSDSIVGGSGTDVLYAGDGGVAGAATSVFASSSDSTAQTTIYGGLGLDSLSGGAGSTVIYAGDGGASGAPTSVFAGSGDTTIYGGLGTDLIQGGSGTDVLYAGDGGMAGAPTTVIGGSGAATLYGGAGEALLQDTASDGQDLLVAGTSDDSLIGVGGDTLVAGAGSDVLQNNGGTLTVDANAGFGSIDATFNGSGTDDLVFGTGQAPTDFSGSIGLDPYGHFDLVLAGGGGSITLQGGLTGTLGSVSFADSGPISAQALLLDLFGGDQATVSANGSLELGLTDGESLSGNLTYTSDTISSWGNNTTISGANNYYGDTIYAAGADDSISGGGVAGQGRKNGIAATGNGDSVVAGFDNSITVSGADAVVQAGAGNDTVTASGSNDTLIGSTGNTTFYVNDASTVIQAPTGGGNDTVFASVSYVAPANVNVLTLAGAGNIVATGNAGNDMLTGGAGADTLVAGGGIDTLIGGSGATTFVVDSASDVVQDSSATANNTLQSSVSYTLPTHVNTLVLTGSANLSGTANAGNDTLVSNSGVDTLVGGSGNDTFVVSNASDVVQDSSSTASNSVQSSVSYALPTDVNTLVLTGSGNLMGTANGGNDTLVSNGGVDTLVGGAGNDLFIVNNSADVLLNVTASDTIESSVAPVPNAGGAPIVLTGNADLSVTGGAAGGVITANSGNDTLAAGAGATTLIGGAGNDTFVVNSTADVVQDGSTVASNTLQSSVSYAAPTNVNTLVLTGSAALTGTANAGNDTLVSNSGVDTLVGGAGNDSFVVNNAGDVVQDGSATASNTIQSSVSYTLPNNVNTLQLTGSANLAGTTNSGNDLVTGNAGNDTLSATSGTDTLVAGAGVDTLSGGTGNDLFVVNNTADVVTVGAAYGVDTIQSSASYTLPANVQTLVLTGSANLSGTAVSGNNAITGNAGNDVLTAGSGIDTLVAGSGIDTLVGGSAGRTTFVVNNAADVIENIPTAGDNVDASVNFVLPTNIDTLNLTGGANLVGTGNSDANNWLSANAGNDTLVSGTGVTNFVGGSGNDTFVLNNIGDVVQASATSSNIIESSVSYTLPANVTTLQLTGTADLTGTGGTQAASIVGNAGNDTLVGGVGNDTLVAGSGLATLVGGVGNDTFVINNAGDVIEDTVTGENSTLISSVSATLLTNITTLVLSGSADLTGTANSANDSIVGNAGNDTLMAGSGNDTLVAGAGLDTLVGGSGNTSFVVNNSADVIQGASATASNAVLTSASYVAPANVNALTLTGPGNIAGTGNAGDDTLTGGEGVDTLVAGSGTDTLIGGSGATTFVVNNTSDVVQDSSTNAANTIQASVSYALVANVNTLQLTGSANLSGTANGGNDTLISNSGVDTLTGGVGNETFVVNNASDVVQDASTTANNTAQASVSYALAANVNTLMLTGSANLSGTANSGNDTLVSNSGVDTLVGGTGNDTFVVNNADDVVQDSSTTASNTVQASASYTLPTNVNTLVLTGTANLSATGNAANDVITANAGADTLVSGSDVDTLIGGAGNDIFVVNNTGDVVQDDSSTASNTVESSVNDTLAANVNTLVLTGSASLSGTANSGNDTLVSNSGVDTLVGGSGHDLFIVNNSADVLLNVTASDTVESSVNFTLPSNFNEVVLTGDANISATGNTGNDTLTSGAGIDTLVAGSGIDTLIGGAGNTTFVVDNASDAVQDTASGANNTIQSSVSYTLPANVDTLSLTGTANLTATGNEDTSNVLTANAGNDVLKGTAFATTINGGSGADTIDAGPDANVIYAGNGGTASDPTEVYGNAAGTSVSTQSTIYGGSGTDVIQGGPGSDLIYAGIGSTTINSGSGFDSIYGSNDSYIYDASSGNDLLVAGGGAETLVGMGADTMMGGSGADQIYNDRPLGSSVVYEFDQGFGQDTVGTDNVAGVGTLYFGTGIEPSNVTLGAAYVSANAGPKTDSGVALVINTGSGSVTVRDGLEPGTVTAVDFADTGSQSLAQLMNAAGPGLQTIQDNNNANQVISTGDDQSITNNGTDDYIFAFGNNDVVTDNPNFVALIYGYGDNETITGEVVWAGGSGDVIDLSGSYSATLAGANDTVVAGNGNETFVVQQSSAVIETGSDAGSDSVDAYVNYILPANIQSLTLDSTVGGLAAESNAQGGTLIAGASFDTLTGGAGRDTLVAQGSDDVLVGGAGGETYVLQNTTDTIQFGTGNASLNAVQTDFSYALTGAANALTITANYSVGTGNSANDLLTAAGVGDTLVGGAGNDTFVVNSSSTVVLDSSATANNVIQSTVNYVLPTNVNTLMLIGSSGLMGTANNANDSITANTGYDTLVAGSGNDTLAASGAGNAFVFNVGFGQDQIVNPGSGAVIEFGAGIAQTSLTFTALPGTSGSAPSFVISGDGGAVTVQGGLVPGAISGISFSGGSTMTVPQLIAPSGDVTVAGANGNLILSPGNDDSVTGGTGQDTISTWGSDDTLSAGTGGAVIYAGGSNDQVTGSAATDTLDAIGANDTLVGGTGSETFLVNDASTVIQGAAGQTQDTLFSSVSYTAPASVSVMTLTGTASGLKATGNSGADVITANDGNYDTLVSGAGVDTLIGGANYDTFVVNNSDDVVQVSPTTTQDEIVSSVSYTLPNNVDSLILANAVGGITATGNAGNDYISDSTGGGNTLIAGSGNDALNADYALYDVLIGGAGNDTLSVNRGSYADYGGGELISGSGIDDLVVYERDVASLVINNTADSVLVVGDLDTIESSVSYTLTNSDVTSYTSRLSFSLTGSANLTANDQTLEGDVSVFGNAGNDTLIAGPAGGSLFAGSGVDTLIGGSGATSFHVNNSADVVFGHSGADSIYSSANYTLPASVGYLYLSGSVGVGNTGADTLVGSYDTLVAGSGNDSLVSEGNSTLIAGSGNDTLSALNYNDVLVFNTGFGNAQVKVAQDAVNGPTVQFGTGIGAGNLTASAVLDVNGQAALAISGASGTITLDGALSGDPYQFQFAGGEVMTLAQFLTQVNIATSSVVGAAGNLVFEGNASVAVTGGTGNDSIYAFAADDSVTGGSGNQLLEVLGPNASVVGGSNNDTLVGLGSNDTLVAGAAVDTLVGGTGGSVQFLINNTSDVIQLQTGYGVDTVVSSASYTLPEDVDTLILTGTDALTGTANSENDTLTSNTGIDTLIGGTGNDTFVVNNASDVIQDGSTSASNTIQTAFICTLPTDIDTLILTGTSALSGTANSDDDTLVSNSGVDTLIGGTGNDTFIVNNAGDIIQDSSSTASNTIETGFSYTLPTDINTLILTGTAALTGTANSANDTLTSNSGVDTLVGGAGNDTFVVNNAADVIQDSSGTANNTIQTAFSYTLPTDINTLILTGSNDVIGTGNSANDTLTSNTGVDTLIGGAGNDTFVINNASDVIQDSSTTASNIVMSAVSYTLPTNVNTLVLTGSANLSGSANAGNDSITGNAGSDTLNAGAGNDTLVAGTGVATLIGGTGNDVFVINKATDAVQDASTMASNTIQSSVSYVLPTNVNSLVLTGSTALKGTANGGNDTLTSNTGKDTLVGGAGNDTFIVDNVSDVVQDTSTTTNNAIQSSVSFTLPTNVNTLTLTGTGALKGTANSGNDTLFSNTGKDTLVGGTGNDLFVVNNASDKVTVGSTHGTDTIQSSVSYVLPTNVQYLTLTGSSNLTGTGNSLTDLIVGNTGNDTLTGGTGIAVLEGGATGGKDLLQATKNQAALIGGGASATLKGGTYKDFYAVGAVSDSITTGATANVIAINKGDGADTLAPTTSAKDVLSLGAGIDTENLYFTKSGNNLVLTDGVSGDSITFTNWYSSSSDQDVTTLQVVEIASTSYNASGSDALRNKALEVFNFTSLVSQFNTAGSPADWALSNGMPGAGISMTANTAYGGDLAYYDGLNGNLTGMSLTAAQATLTNSSYATGAQTIDAWSSISGGALSLQADDRIASATSLAADPVGSIQSDTAQSAVPVHSAMDIVATSNLNESPAASPPGSPPSATPPIAAAPAAALALASTPTSGTVDSAPTLPFRPSGTSGGSKLNVFQQIPWQWRQVHAVLDTESLNAPASSGAEFNDGADEHAGWLGAMLGGALQHGAGLTSRSLGSHGLERH